MTRRGCGSWYTNLALRLGAKTGPLHDICDVATTHDCLSFSKPPRSNGGRNRVVCLIVYLCILALLSGNSI